MPDAAGLGSIARSRVSPLILLSVRFPRTWRATRSRKGESGSRMADQWVRTAPVAMCVRRSGKVLRGSGEGKGSGKTILALRENKQEP